MLVDKLLKEGYLIPGDITDELPHITGEDIGGSRTIFDFEDDLSELASGGRAPNDEEKTAVIAFNEGFSKLPSPGCIFSCRQVITGCGLGSETWNMLFRIDQAYKPTGFVGGLPVGGDWLSLLSHSSDDEFGSLFVEPFLYVSERPEDGCWGPPFLMFPIPNASNKLAIRPVVMSKELVLPYNCSDQHPEGPWMRGSYMYENLHKKNWDKLTEDDFYNDPGMEALLKTFCVGITVLLHRLIADGVDKEDKQPSEKLNKRRISRGHPEMVSHTVVKIKPYRAPMGRSGPRGDDYTPIRYHFRRGHVRRFANGQKTWVRSCFVGDINEGRVHHTYKVSA